MTSLVRKSWRDLWATRWQAIGVALLVTIVVVLVCGGMRARAMLLDTREGWYERLHMADIEIVCSPTLPDAVASAADIDGIEAAEERLLLEGRVEMTDSERALPALIRVLPSDEPKLNRLQLLEGRYPHPDEKAAVVDRSCQTVHGAELGDRVTVTVGEHTFDLPVVGISLTPEHFLYPAHPEYILPLRGTVAVLGVSKATIADIEHSHRVNSLLFRLRDDVDLATVEQGLIEALPVAIQRVQPLEKDPSRMFTEMIIRTYDIYMPAVAVLLVLIALVLLVLTHVRLVQRQEKTIGTLLAMGHGPGRVALGFMSFSIVPTLVGALLGAVAHGAFSRHIFSGYADSVGYAPLIDNGPGPALPLVIAACVGVSLLACVVPVVAAARCRPSSLLRPSVTTVLGEDQRFLVGLAARLRDLLRLPIAVVLGLTNIMRRRWATAGAVLGLGGIFSVVLAFLLVHVTHRAEVTASVDRLGVDATLNFTDPVGDDVLAEASRLADGYAEPVITKLAVLEYGEGPRFRRVMSVGLDGWLKKLKLARGRVFEDVYANEVVIDHWIAKEEGLDVGDDISCFPFANSPEGVDLRVVGVLDGVSLGLAVIPLETGRNLFGLSEAATSSQVRSDLPDEELESALWNTPKIETVFAMNRARSQVEANFEGSEAVLRWGLFMSIGVAVLFLAILAALDAGDRAPDLAVLQALGWRNRALLGLCLTEVMSRGIVALLLALPAAPLLARWLLHRIEQANHYRMTLLTPAWLIVLMIGLALVLMPLGALPAWRASRRVTPARAMRMLTRE